MKVSSRSATDARPSHAAPGGAELIGVERSSTEATGLARIPAQGGAPVNCRHCAAPAPERLVRVVGAWSVIDGVAVWDCEGCLRAGLEEIETGSAAYRTGSTAYRSVGAR